MDILNSRHCHGYHPLLCYDGLTGDLLKAFLYFMVISQTDAEL